MEHRALNMQSLHKRYVPSFLPSSASVLELADRRQRLRPHWIGQASENMHCHRSHWRQRRKLSPQSELATIIQSTTELSNTIVGAKALFFAAAE